MGEGRSFGLPYVPGLDGLRAIAVVVVIAFHLEVPGFDGGFLGVSLFFTLSGYLITQLIVREHDATGRVSLAGFWSRRFRRLMPAALVAIGAIAVTGLATDLFRGARLRGDLASALGYAANWRFAFGSRSYSELFTSAASPVQHFWSLAIEEQFYFVFPLLMVGLLAVRRRRAVAIGLGALFVASVVAGLATRSHDLVYYGSHVRAAELLAGALLALVMPVGRSLDQRVARASAALGVTALVGTGVLVAVVDTRDGWLYDGGLAAFSSLSALLVVAALVPGPVRALVSTRPLAAIGRISYGLYVFHWPVIVAMSPERVRVDRWLLDVLRVVVTVALALASWRFVEQPIRRRRRLVHLRPAVATAVASFASIGVAVAFVPHTGATELAGLAAPDEVVAFGSDSESTSVTSREIVSIPPSDPDLRIVVVGSSPNVARRLEAGRPDGADFDVVDLSRTDCPLRPGGGTRNGCPSIEELVTVIGNRTKPDLVVVSLGSAERDLIQRLIGRPMSPDRLESDDMIVHSLNVTRSYVQEVAAKLSGYTIVFFDDGTRDVLTAETSNLEVSREDVYLLDDPTPAELKVHFGQFVRLFAGDDSRQKVMVIGDSTSYGIAEALSTVAGDRFDVLWAGGRNCPIVEAERVRWWPEMEFDVSSCPRVADWKLLWPEFTPALLLIVSSVPEQSEQRYEDGGRWRMVGDDEFFERHARTVEEIVALADSTSTKVVFFSSPRIRGGALGDAKFALDKRVNGWNRTIDRLVGKWPQLQVLDWASIVAAAEGGEVGSLRRGDGVHMMPDDLRAVVGERVVPALTELLAVPVASAPVVSLDP